MMKRISLLISTMLFAVCMNSMAQNIHIDKSAFVMKFKNGDTKVELNSLDLTDTATVIGFSVTGRPHYWISIEPTTMLVDGNGKEYKIRSAEGIGINKRFCLPDNGRHSYKLSFEPLPADIDKFDCIENRGNSEFNFYGIVPASTLPMSELPDGWSNLEYGGDETLPSSFAGVKGKATVNVKIIGQSHEMKGWYAFCDFIDPTKKSADDMYSDLRIDDNGNVRIVRDVLYPSCSTISVYDTEFKVILAPEVNTSVLIDLNRPTGQQVVGFKGDFARTCMELSGGYRQLPDSLFTQQDYFEKKIRKEMKNIEPTFENTKVLIDRVFNDAKQTVERQQLTDATKRIMKMDIEGAYIEWRTDIQYQLKWAAFIEEVPESERPARAHEFLESYAVPDLPVPLPGSYPSLECIDSDYITYCYAYKSLTNGENRPTATRQANKDFITMYNIVYENDPWDAERVAEVKDANCRKALDTFKHWQDSAKAAMSANLHYLEYDNVKPEEILDTILSNHKGRAVLVDVWTTQCGPCRIGHRQMAPLKKELADSPIDFVYITCPTSPFQTWYEVVAEVPGEHYYLTDTQYNYILANYDSKGIPTYALYDKERRIAYKSIGLMSNEKLMREIRKVIDVKP